VKRNQKDRAQEDTMEGLDRNMSALYSSIKRLRNLTIGAVAFIILFNIILFTVGVVVANSHTNEEITKYKDSLKGISYLINQFSKYAQIWQNRQVLLGKPSIEEKWMNIFFVRGCSRVIFFTGPQGPQVAPRWLPGGPQVAPR
jgi:hypothetical protein